MNRFRLGDNVIVTTGKSKGHIGNVLKVSEDKVIVEGGNLIKKHVKANPQAGIEGGIVSREAPLHVSNVAHFNPITKKADKVGFKYLETEGARKKVRFYKSNNEIIDRV